MLRFTTSKFVRARAMTLLSLVPLAAAGCVLEADWFGFSDRRPFDPPDHYDALWSEVQTCAGIPGDIARIQWFTARSINSNGFAVLGQWMDPHDIMLREDSVNDNRVVKHEMLHDLLRGDPTHSQLPWQACQVLSGVDI